jgi:hypothetical protein
VSEAAPCTAPPDGYDGGHGFIGFTQDVETLELRLRARVLGSPPRAYVCRLCLRRSTVLAPVCWPPPQNYVPFVEHTCVSTKVPQQFSQMSRSFSQWQPHPDHPQ